MRSQIYLSPSKITQAAGATVTVSPSFCRNANSTTWAFRLRQLVAVCCVRRTNWDPPAVLARHPGGRPSGRAVRHCKLQPFEARTWHAAPGRCRCNTPGAAPGTRNTRIKQATKSKPLCCCEDQVSGRVDRQNVGACSQQPGSGECASRRSDFTELKLPDMNGWLRRLPNSESRTLGA